MLPATVLVATQGEGMESVRSMLTSGYRVTPGKANSTGVYAQGPKTLPKSNLHTIATILNPST